VTDIAVSEFPFVADLPKREKGKLQTLWDNYSEVSSLVKEHGMLIPCAYAAELAGVTKQRIHVLCDQERLKSVHLNSLRFVTEASFLEWMRAEHKNGRPFKAPSLKESIAMARRASGKDSSK